MSATAVLDVYAGAGAMRVLRERGLRVEDVTAMAGASGGPKWIVLYGLDRMLMREFFGAPSRDVVDLIGSSSGAWRMTCHAQASPLEALDRFAEAYIHQCYPPKPPLSLVSKTCGGIVSHMLGPTGAREILDNPRMRLHVLTAACRGWVASDVKPLLMTGLLGATLANMGSRRTLGWSMTRTVFYPPPLGDGPFARLHDLPTRMTTLTEENMAGALLATGSIPMLANAVDIADAPWGRHRDGALTDYHLDLDYGDDDGIVLYPHFFRRVLPGWLDKFAPWRRPSTRNFDRVVMLVPSADFVRRLPRAKLPDRDDFYQLSDADRIRAWETVRDESAALGDDLRGLIATGRIADRARPLPWVR